VECFDHRGALRPETGFINLETAIVSLDWLADLRGKLCKVFRGDQSAIRLHVITDATGDGTTIEIVTCGHEPGVAIVTRAFRGETLGANDLAQRPRQIGLHKEVAD